MPRCQLIHLREVMHTHKPQLPGGGRGGLEPNTTTPIDPREEILMQPHLVFSVLSVLSVVAWVT